MMIFSMISAAVTGWISCSFRFTSTHFDGKYLFTPSYLHAHYSVTEAHCSSTGLICSLTEVHCSLTQAQYSATEVHYSLTKVFYSMTMLIYSLTELHYSKTIFVLFRKACYFSINKAIFGAISAKYFNYPYEAPY